MGAGRRKGWWLNPQYWEKEFSDEENYNEKDKDGRFKSERSERRVPSTGHAERGDGTKI